MAAFSSGDTPAAAGRPDIVIKTEAYSNESEIHMASEIMGYEVSLENTVARRIDVRRFETSLVV